MAIFKKKHKAVEPVLTFSFCNVNGDEIECMKLSRLPLDEKAIIKHSIEFFNDPEPCMIHKSAVMQRLFMEWEDYVCDMAKEKLTIEIDSIPVRLNETIKIPDGASKIYLYYKLIL